MGVIYKEMDLIHSVTDSEDDNDMLIEDAGRMVTTDSDSDDASENSGNPGEVFLKACEQGNSEAVKNLLAEDGNLITYRDSDGYTCLHRASHSGNTETVRLLLTHGADIEARTDDGWTPLHSAAFWNTFECVRVLIDNHADVNAQTQGGQTPLHLSGSHGEAKESIILLLTCPFTNPGILNNNNETACTLAQRSGKLAYLFDITKDSINKI